MRNDTAQPILLFVNLSICEGLILHIPIGVTTIGLPSYFPVKNTQSYTSMVKLTGRLGGPPFDWSKLK